MRESFINSKLNKIESHVHLTNEGFTQVEYDTSINFFLHRKSNNVDTEITK